LSGTNTRPPFDPWLKHLRRDRRGLPVPYVNLWGQQTLGTTRVAYDRWVGRDAVFVDDVGDVPNFVKQSPQRQRECMVNGLCQVCARPVPWSRRNLVLAGVSVDFVRVGNQRRAVVFEPWLDDRCLHIALAWCPALIRRRRDEKLEPHPIRSRRDVELVLSEGWVEGDLAAATQARPVGMLVKAALLTLDVRPGG
jgi:hypothetical protein